MDCCRQSQNRLRRVIEGKGTTACQQKTPQFAAVQRTILAGITNSNSNRKQRSIISAIHPNIDCVAINFNVPSHEP